jgi:hypothetical protein
MADTTTVMALPFPEGSDANDVPADMQALAERLDDAPGIESLTSAQIAALTAGQKPAGRVVYNSTTSEAAGVQRHDVREHRRRGAAAGRRHDGRCNIAMGSNKITGLAAGTTATVTPSGTSSSWPRIALEAVAAASSGAQVWHLVGVDADADRVRYDPTFASTSPTRTATRRSARPSQAKAQVTGHCRRVRHLPHPAAGDTEVDGIVARRIGWSQMTGRGSAHYSLEQAKRRQTYCHARR